MPNVPGWFQATDYFFNKLNQMRDTASADYTAEQLVAAFNEAGYTIAGTTETDIVAADEQLFRHFNDWGNAENVSPNNYFNVATYKTNKLAQVIADGQAVPEGFTEWNEAALNAAMERAGLSYWDHYTQYGTAEGINPSAAFDTDDYLQKKADQLNNLPEGQQQPLPDGTLGDWTPELVAEAFRDADLNAVEHYMLYNASENIGYVPGPEQPATEQQLTTGVDEYNDNGISTNFVATNAPGSEQLNPGDKITATNAGSELTLTLNNEGFDGFDSNGGMKGVQTINISGFGAFDATGVEGAKTYNITGNTHLFNLGKDVETVNLNDVDDAVNVQLATAAQAGDTALVLGLDNVYTSTVDAITGETSTGAVKVINLGGIETLTVNSTGTGTNIVDLSSAAAMTTLNVTGSNDVSIDAVDRKLATIDAHDATGDVTVTASAAANLKTVTGGAGDDTLVYSGTSARTLNLTSTDLETLQFNNTGTITVNGSNMKGLESIALKGQNSTVTLNKFNGQNLNIDVIGGKENAELTSSAAVKAADVAGLNFNVSEYANYAGSVTAAKATSLGIDGAGDFTLGNGGNLANVSNITVEGAGNVNLSANRAIGSKAQNLFVQAGADEGMLTARFDGGTVKDQNLFVYGGDNGEINITANAKAYDFIQVAAGSGNDSLTIDAGGTTVLNSNNLSVDLGGGDNTLTVLHSKAGSDFSGLSGISTLYIDNIANVANRAELEAAGVNVQQLTSTKDGGIQIDAVAEDGVVSITPAAGVANQTVDFSGVNGTVDEIVISPSETPVILDNLDPTGDTLSITTGADTTVAYDTSNPGENNLDQITTLTVTVEDGAEFSTEMPSSGSGKMLVNATDLSFSGNGSVVIPNQIGAAATPQDLTIESSGLTGGFSNNSGANTVVAKNFTFTGGDGDDYFGVSSFGNSTIDLGNGDNTLGYLFGWAATEGGGKTKAVTATITMGEAGGGIDEVQIRASNQLTSGMTSSQGAGSIITINNFEAGTDVVTNAGDTSTGGGVFATFVASTGSTTESAGSASIKTGTGDSTVVQLLHNFGITDTTDITYGKIDTNGSAAGGDTWVAIVGDHNYAIFDTGNGSIINASKATEASVDIRSVAVIDFVGVSPTDVVTTIA